MVEKAAAAGRFSWRLPLCFMIVWLAGFATIAVCDPDVFFFLSIISSFPALLIISIALPIYAACRDRRQLLPILAMLALLWAIAVSLFRYNREHPFALHETAKWLAWSGDYKRQVLAQPASVNGALKHIEWDGTGFAGVAYNTVYLVFDPADTLSAAAGRQQSGKLSGIPCDVRLVRRLESHWYAILLYTDEFWEKCN